MADLLPPERLAAIWERREAVHCDAKEFVEIDPTADTWWYAMDITNYTRPELLAIYEFHVNAATDMYALKHHITVQAERNAALEAALKPFAALAEHIFEGEPDDKALIACLAEPDDDPDLPVFTIGDARRAHKVLEGE